MNDRAQIVKTALMMELAKEGKTLVDFENELKGSIEKKAAGWFIDPSKVTDIGKGLFNAYGASLAAAGMLGGTGLYAAHLMNEDSTNQQLKKQKERDQYLEAAKSLEGKIHHPNTL